MLDTSKHGVISLKYEQCGFWVLITQVPGHCIPVTCTFSIEIMRAASRENRLFAYAKTKTQISFAVTALFSLHR